LSKLTPSLRDASVRALRVLLLDVQRDPGEYLHAGLEPFLRSQGKLATLHRVDLGITSSSLNTLKRHSSHVEGGFTGLDRLRKSAAAALAHTRSAMASAPKDTKRALTARITELDEELHVAHQDLMLLTRLLETALRQAREYAAESRNEAIVRRCAEDQSDIRDMATQRRTSAAKVTVIRRSRG